MAKFTLFTIITAALAAGQVDAFRFRFCQPVLLLWEIAMPPNLT
jgi:hypothetical protein